MRISKAEYGMRYAEPGIKMEEDTVKKGKSPGRKRSTIPKDRHAPKRPISAYNLFATSERVKLKKQNPDRSFGEMNREIGSLWTTLTPAEKQPYLEEAEVYREKYLKEVEEYQKTENYKKYLQTIAALQQRQYQKKVEKEQTKQKKRIPKQQKDSSSSLAATAALATPPSLPPPSRPPPLSLKQSFVTGTEIPIFTNQFLVHNRELEVQVRKHRQTTSDLEEENALLSRHVDNMITQSERLGTEIQNQKLQNQILRSRLTFLQDTLTDAFSSVSIPGIDSVPSVDTIADYLKQVETAIVVAKQPSGDDDDEHSNVVATVRRVAKELVERVRERETQDEKMDDS